jgi:hypothetical protein
MWAVCACCAPTPVTCRPRGRAPCPMRFTGCPTSPRWTATPWIVQMEQAAFAENAVQYQASLDFLNSRFRGLRTALKGE